MNNKKQAVTFKGIFGLGLEPVNQLLAEFCQLVAEKNIFINYTSLIEDVLRPHKKVESQTLPFIKINEPNTVELRELMEELEVRTNMPTDQKRLANVMLQSVDVAAWTNANPHAYALAAYTNALVTAFATQWISIVDADALWDSLESTVESYRSQE